MSTMEGFLMKKGWFNNWKMRYVTCTESVLAIYKNKGDDNTGNTFNVIDCSIKKIDPKRWNRKFVFRLKVAGKRIYLAAEDETSFNKWITVIQGRVKRQSLLGANALRCATGDRRRSTLASLSRADCQKLSEFKLNDYTASYKKATTSSTDPESQFKFAEVCGEFLAMAHARAKDLFELNEIRELKGLTARFVQPDERKKILKEMKALSHLASFHLSDVYFPLQCLIDYTGRTLFMQVEVEGTETLSPKNAKRITELGLDPAKTKALEDSEGYLWIMSTALKSHKAKKNAIENFVHDLDYMQVFVFDSQSLADSMRSHSIPVSKLPELAEKTTIPSIRVLIQIEMIARVCKHLISEKLLAADSLQWTQEIIKFYNLILGNSKESDQFWEETLIPAIKKKFGVDLNKQIPLLHMPQLFFSLQFHTGADFKDISEYNFNDEHPILLEHLNSINAVPHHFLVEICTSLREIPEDPYKQLTNGFYNNATLTLNNKVSLFQSIYGDENIYVASGLSQLSQAYLGLGDMEKAELCARGAIGACRHFYGALIPAYITLISVCKPSEIDNFMNEALGIINFQLSDTHWFEADVLIASSKAKQNANDLQTAAKLAQSASEIVHPLLGPSHPKTAYCSLLQGRINRMMGHFANAQPLIQQALFSMTVAFGGESAQVSECEFDLADVLLESGKLTEAEAEAIKAYNIRKNIFKPDDTHNIECIQQLAIIYDTMNVADKAFDYDRQLMNFLKSLEDETIFDEMVKVMRNILCLFFRAFRNNQRQVINQLKRSQPENEAIKATFQKLIDNDPIDFSTNLFEQYMKNGEPSDFDSLSCIYHIAMDDMTQLTWLQEH